jgi:hypothetical protein
MPKSKTALSEDADLIEAKPARDEISQDEPTKTQLKKIADPAATTQNINNNFSAATPTINNTPSFNAGPAATGFAPPNTNTTTGFGSTGSTTPSFGSSSAQPTNAYQQQANADMDKQILTQQHAKENENWVKTYWRPAMGWLYMIICGMDFVGFPLLTIFLPVIFQPFGLTVPYQVWTSLTLSNGGLIHLSFGAILGVAAFTRGQEKIAGKS